MYHDSKCYSYLEKNILKHMGDDFRNFLITTSLMSKSNCKVNSNLFEILESKVDLPEYKVKEHEKTPYEKPKYEEKPVEPTKLPEIYEVPLKEITPGYYKPKEEYKPTEEPKEEYEPKEEPKEEYKPESIEESKEEWKPEEPKAESKETSKEVSKEVSKEASKEEETASEILKPEEKSPEPIKFAEKYEVPEYAKAPPGEIKK